MKTADTEFNDAFCSQIADKYIEKANKEGGDNVQFKEFKTFSSVLVKGLGADISKDKLEAIFNDIGKDDGEEVTK